ncbi:MAG: helix-turn-helix domain-containing protein [Lachnospiraceae bacterium]
MRSYKRFYYSDYSDIALEHWNGSMSQTSHMHKYFELVLIEKGSCLHMFQGNETMLIPGDSFLVPPEVEHGFTINEHTSIYNCQFYPHVIDEETFRLISNSVKIQQTDASYPKSSSDFRADINKQGIVHLFPNEFSFLLSLLKAMEEEQEKQENHSILLKKKYLELILVIYCKRLEQQYKNYDTAKDGRQKTILQVLTSIENNLTETIDFNEIAALNGLSTNHFRKLFKDTTGLSPVDYVNRLRITKACENARGSDMNISELAASVGIYDANYFSRLFKQYMGCSPKKYFSLSD